MFKTIFTGVLALAVGAAFAQHSHHQGHPPAKKSPSKAASPKAFACVHCGRKIALRSSADLKKTCAVCKCGTTNAACKPVGDGR